MTKFLELKPISAAVGAILASSAFIVTPVTADENPFQMLDLNSGHMVADSHGGKHDKMKMMDTDGDGSVSKDEFITYAEKKFNHKDKNGDSVLSADEMKHMKHHGEGKCDYKNSDG